MVAPCARTRDPNMETKTQTFIETEEDISLPNEEGLVPAGIYGDSDVPSMLDRERRTADFKKRYDYHEIVPCCICCNCIEFRRFLPTGEAVTVGFYCHIGEMQTTEFHTCTCARPRKNGRRRVVYYRENAPSGFEAGLAPVQMKRYFTKKERQRAIERSVRDGYRGGSSSYQRADGNNEAVGSGQIPKGLGN